MKANEDEFDYIYYVYGLTNYKKMPLIEPFCSFFLYRIPEFHNAFRSLISTRVALTCNKDNPAARRLYEKKGFTATGVEDEDEIELVLNLE